LTLEQTHASRWFDATFSVDGVPERFRMIGDEPHWLAYRENEDTWLFVHSRGFPPASIELVHVDPRDYLSDG